MNSKLKKSRVERQSAKANVLAATLPILLLAMSLLFLTACSTRSATLVLDPRLTAPCERPELMGPTNRDVWVWAGEQQMSIRDCADRIDAIRGLTR